MEKNEKFCVVASSLPGSPLLSLREVIYGSGPLTRARQSAEPLASANCLHLIFISKLKLPSFHLPPSPRMPLLSRTNRNAF